jgi:hypothetical protein
MLMANISCFIHLIFCIFEKLIVTEKIGVHFKKKNERNCLQFLTSFFATKKLNRTSYYFQNTFWQNSIQKIFFHSYYNLINCNALVRNKTKNLISNCWFDFKLKFHWDAFPRSNGMHPIVSRLPTLPVLNQKFSWTQWF